MKNIVSLLVAALLSTTMALPAAAETSDKDLQIIGRALSYVTNGPKGDVGTAIVFEPGNAASEADKAALEALLGPGFKAGDFTFKGTPVPVAQAGSAGASFKVWMVARGAGGALGKAGAGAKAITVSTDKACAEAGNCVIAVESAPKVQIYVSRAAAEAAGVSFASAFLMMVKEL